MKLSYSQISVYKRCPKQWHYKYVVKTPGKPDNRVFLEGKVVHSLNELYLRSDNRSVDFVLAQAPHVFTDEIKKQHIKLREDEEELTVYSNIIGSFLKLLKKQQELGILKAKEPQLEWWFTIPIEGTKHTITGASDIIYSLDAGASPRILDYKNTDSMFFLDRDQLVTYDLAYTKKYGVKPEKAGFLLIKSSNVVWHDIFEEDHVRLMEFWVRLVTDIDIILLDRSKSFEPKPEYQKCKWCSYKEDCAEAELVRPEKLVKNSGQLSL